MADIVYSRHSRRRMKLYGISEDDIETAYTHGSRIALPDGRIELLCDMADRFQYPLKVVGVETEKGFLVVTAYPLKGVRKDGEI